MNHKSWYDGNIPKYEFVINKAKSGLEHSFDREAIKYPLIQARVKNFGSLKYIAA